MKNAPSPFVRPAAFHADWQRAHVEDTFPRPACLRCGETVVWLGEALRIECAEGRAVVAHVCRGCQRSGACTALRAHAGTQERPAGTQMRRAA